VRHDPPVLSRVALGICALLVLGWLVVLVRDYYVGDDAATSLLYRTDLSDRDFQHYIDRLGEAELLNPDKTVELARGSYQLVRGNRDAAAREAEHLVRMEPENLNAWILLYRATNGHEPAKAARAVAAIKRLNPRSDISG
jgi:hypothetical protein